MCAVFITRRLDIGLSARNISHTHTQLRPICLEHTSQCSIKHPSNKRLKWLPFWVMSSKIKCIGVYCTLNEDRWGRRTPLSWIYCWGHNDININSYTTEDKQYSEIFIPCPPTCTMCFPDCVTVCDRVLVCDCVCRLLWSQGKNRHGWVPGMWVSCCNQAPYVLIVQDMVALQHWETRGRRERHCDLYRNTIQYRQAK